MIWSDDVAVVNRTGSIVEAVVRDFRHRRRSTNLEANFDRDCCQGFTVILGNVPIPRSKLLFPPFLPYITARTRQKYFLFGLQTCSQPRRLPAFPPSSACTKGVIHLQALTLYLNFGLTTHPSSSGFIPLIWPHTAYGSGIIVISRPGGSWVDFHLSVRLDKSNGILPYINVCRRPAWPCLPTILRVRFGSKNGRKHEYCMAERVYLKPLRLLQFPILTIHSRRQLEPKFQQSYALSR